MSHRNIQSILFCDNFLALLYSAQTKSFNPDSAEKLAHENDKLIVTDLLTKKVLK